MKNITAQIGSTQKELHPDDFRQDTYGKLLEIVATKQEVCFVRFNGVREYGYISSESKHGVFVKFSQTLLDFLYTEDAWEATTAKLCDRSQIQFIYKFAVGDEVYV